MNYQWWSILTSNCSCSKDTSRAFPQYEFSCAPWDARTWRKFCRNHGTCKKKFSSSRTLAKEEEEWFLWRSSLQLLEVSSHPLLFSAHCPCLNNCPSALEWYIFSLWGFPCQGPPVRDLPKVLAQDQTITAKIKDFSCNRQISSQTVITQGQTLCVSFTLPRWLQSYLHCFHQLRDLALLRHFPRIIAHCQILPAVFRSPLDLRDLLNLSKTPLKMLLYSFLWTAIHHHKPFHSKMSALSFSLPVLQ